MSNRKQSEQEPLPLLGIVFEFTMLFFHAFCDQGSEDRAIRKLIKGPSIAKMLRSIFFGEQQEVQHILFLLVEDASSPVCGIIARVCNAVRTDKEYVGVTDNVFYRSNAALLFDDFTFVPGTMQTLNAEFSKWLSEQLIYGDVVLHMPYGYISSGCAPKERIREVLAFNGLTSDEQECISIVTTSELFSMPVAIDLYDIINEWRNKLRRDLHNAHSLPS